jgi:hypothetical protein
MKQSLLLHCFLLFSIFPLFAQKPQIDTSVFGKWPSLSNPKISHDGKYFLYSISNVPHLYGNSCIIQQLKTGWKKELPNIQTAESSEDSRKAIFPRGDDTLTLLTLGGNKEEHIYPVGSYRLFMQNQQQWLLCQLNTSDKQLLLKNLTTGKEIRIAGVERYLLSKTGKNLIYVTSDTANTDDHLIYWADISRGSLGRSYLVWRGVNDASLILDNAEIQLAIAVSGSTSGGYSIWYYSRGEKTARKIADSSLESIPASTYIQGLSNFSIDGKRLLLYLKEKPYEIPVGDAVMVDVWSYHDAKIQSHQLKEDVDETAGVYHKGPRSFLAVQNVSTLQINQLQYKDEEIKILSNGTSDKFGIVTYREGDPSEEHWNRLAVPSYYLISTETGTRNRVPIRFNVLSPTGKYLLGSDNNTDFYTYEITTGIIRKVTSGFNMPDQINYTIMYSNIETELKYCGWIKNDSFLIIQDRFDLWLIDPVNIQAPKNITNGFGRRNCIRFNFANYILERKIGDAAILDAFNDDNQQNGFYSIIIGQTKEPIKLHMSSNIYAAVPYGSYLTGSPPVKARDKDVYVAGCQNANSPINYLYTTDFINFSPITNLKPQQQYNWYTSELIEFYTTKNQMQKGVLYKPENFDSTKKYPVILTYYEKRSERINKFLEPDYFDGDISIPYFVSRGYLVFMPDISYKIGEIGQSALSSILGGRNYLTTLPYVDSTKLGLSGHSLGGFETLYTITQCNVFSAAFADAGPSNFMDQYGRFELHNGISLQGFNETGQSRMGSNLWQRPEVFIDNSPVFEANKITTPLLMVSNKLDAIVHFQQGLQFFLGLRRLGKKAWMLQYDGEEHSVVAPENKKDLAIRVTQFFDHYLKGAPAPKWMLDGMPAKLKGIKSGYEYSTGRETPREGLLIPHTKSD